MSKVQILGALRWAWVCVVAVGVFLLVVNVGRGIVHEVGLSILLEEREDQLTGMRTATIALGAVAAWRVGDAAFYLSWRNGMDSNLRMLLRALMLGSVSYGIVCGFGDYLISDVGKNWYMLHSVFEVVSFFSAMAVVRFGTEFGERHSRLWQFWYGARATVGPRNVSYGFSKAADLRRIGETYLMEKPGKCDVLEAEYWFRSAAMEGDTKAQIELARLLALSSPEPQSPVEALVWLNIASCSADDEVGSARRKVLKTLTPRQIEMAVRLQWLWTARSKWVRHLARRLSGA